MRHNLKVVLGCVALGVAALGACDDESDTNAGGGGEGGGGGEAGSGGGSAIPTATAPHAIAGVFVGSCIPDDGISGTGNSFYDGWLAEVDPTCFVGKANGCDAVEECAGLSTDNAGPCVAACIGQTAEVCDDSWHFLIDCAALGGVCVPEDGDCWDLPPGPCDFDTAVARCDGDLTVYCHSIGLEEYHDCSQRGMGCAVVDGYATCIGLGPACTTYATSCDGDEMVSCASGDREHRVDCDAIAPGFTCQTFAGESFCGLASECNPSSPTSPDEPEYCEGDDVVFCHAGRYEKISCPSLGFSRCEELPNGKAACAPTGVLP